MQLCYRKKIFASPAPVFVDDADDWLYEGATYCRQAHLSCYLQNWWENKRDSEEFEGDFDITV